MRKALSTFFAFVGNAVYAVFVLLAGAMVSACVGGGGTLGFSSGAAAARRRRRR